ncbi:hypothetical protein GGX14DRAFT_409065 [Mycena pura]|uniref:Uncharacterized protein n=1 Tax=Mycena pura TaxID=153505 RepID=A0AAD6UKK5_9AGAR|nr:hypothetical protein GGX14DRAFT_409065 [Mycena pura]
MSQTIFPAALWVFYSGVRTASAPSRGLSANESLKNGSGEMVSIACRDGIREALLMWPRHVLRDGLARRPYRGERKFVFAAANLPFWDTHTIPVRFWIFGARTLRKNWIFEGKIGSFGRTTLWWSFTGPAASDVPEKYSEVFETPPVF